MKTLQYYDQNAQSFSDRTIKIDLTRHYDAFLRTLPEMAKILDAGCGVGRDTLYFLKNGYDVTAFDASKEMVKMASSNTGLDVIQTTFQELDFQNTFDGVWAQASLLHVPYEDTKSVYQKIHTALKSGGIFYASYKYGKDYMQKDERDFYNMTENTILQYTNDLFTVIETWKEADTRSHVAPSPDKAWLHFIAKKA